MRWSEIRKAVEAAGIDENDEICCIACEEPDGDKTLHRIALGTTVKLVEGVSEEARREAAGCAG